MGLKILIVEDHDASRSALVKLLTGAGHDVIEANNFRTGMRLLRDGQPDLLIADVRLGPFNGLQLVATNPNPIPSIIVTGFRDPVVEADARALGAEYVCKPIEPQELLALVTRMSEGGPSPFYPPRRSPRKRLPDSLPAQVDHSTARIIDISYGGLQLELHGAGTKPPTSFRVTLPAATLEVDVDLVWSRQTEDMRWICGAAVSQANPEGAERAWRGLVDATI